MTTKIPAAYAALLARMRVLYPDDTTVCVRDGIPAEELTQPAYLFVGCDDLTGGVVTAVTTGEQEWLDLGAFTKVETFGIWMTLVVSNGSGSYADLTATALTYLGQIEAALVPSNNGSPTGPDGMLGTNAAMGPLGPTGWCNAYTTGFLRGNNKQGVGLIAPIVVNCRTQFTQS